MAHAPEQIWKQVTKAPGQRRAILVVLFWLTGGQALAGDIGQSPTEALMRRVVVSIPARKLTLIEDGQVQRVYDVAVGAPVSPSPVGSFKIVNRVVKPNYYHAGKVVLPGKSNPLGSRWLGLNKASYGIHGTNSPKSIGKATSRGCIRMRNRDVEELFELVRPGDPVEILLEPAESAAHLASPEPRHLGRSEHVPPQVAMAALSEEILIGPLE